VGARLRRIFVGFCDVSAVAGLGGCLTPPKAGATNNAGQARDGAVSRALDIDANIRDGKSVSRSASSGFDALCAAHRQDHLRWSLQQSLSAND
jgi:hypothetical protein